MSFRIVCLLAVVVACRAQNLTGQFDFENGMGGWSYTGNAVLDEAVAHGGKRSVRIEREAVEGFSTITGTVQNTFEGQEVELRGWIRHEGVSGFAALWIRLDGKSGRKGFDSLQKLGLKGTADWKQYSVKIRLEEEGEIVFGFLLSGRGKAWADDLEILVDGRPMSEAPRAKRSLTVIDRDVEFVGGSKVVQAELTKGQIENLVLLGKVWGFAKYHHPRVTAGEFHWDFELFRVLPKVLAAKERSEAQKVLEQWLHGLGEVPECKPCAGPLQTEGLPLRPRIGWIEDEKSLGSGLSGELRRVYARRRVGANQFYVQTGIGAGNAQFQNELEYARLKWPDAGMQLLALYRFWNIVEYWSPYRNLIEEDWDGVMREFIPRLMLARGQEDYQRGLLALLGRVHDSHTGLWSGGSRVQPPMGRCRIPVVFRFVEGRAVVTGVVEDGAGMRVGDVVETVGGRKVGELVREWREYYPASNEEARLRDIAWNLGRGDCGGVQLQGERGGKAMEWSVERRTVDLRSMMPMRWHERPGEVLQRLGKEVVYLKMGSLRNEDVAKYLDQMAGAKAVILDSRSYPAGFTPFLLGQAFVDAPTPFARFTKAADATNPGAFERTPPLVLNPDGKLRFAGKVVVLVDEQSQSSSEYQTMAWSAGPRAKVVGSRTAGADGNVSRIPLPGGEATMISGIGVFYADGRETQRVGIVPGIVVTPTIEGIRAGRDEVLERALREVLGPEVAEAEIVEMARRP